MSQSIIIMQAPPRAPNDLPEFAENQTNPMEPCLDPSERNLDAFGFVLQHQSEH